MTERLSMLAPSLTARAGPARIDNRRTSHTPTNAYEVFRRTTADARQFRVVVMYRRPGAGATAVGLAEGTWRW
jgi:hypothetical protein